jgi:anti-sigma-K factor RskA
MSGDDRHERSARSLGAYALGALEADEAAEVRAHLTACSSCRAELDGLQLAADALATSVIPLRAPPELGERIMAQVRAQAADAATEDRVARPRRHWWQRLATRPATALAAVTLVVLGAVVAGVTLTGDPAAPERVLSARITDRAMEDVARASVRVSGNHARLVVEGLPDPPSRRVYQVWLKSATGPPVAAGATFAVRSGTIEIPRPLRDGEAVLVTHEPAGGSQAPSRPPLIVSAPA